MKFTSLWKTDRGELELRNTAFREQVTWDGDVVSEASLVKPAISRTHRFAIPGDSIRYEVRTYGLDGYLVIQDGAVVASQRPRRWLMVMCLCLGLVNLLDAGTGRFETWDLVAGIIWTLLGVAMLVSELRWRRDERAHAPQPEVALAD